MDSTTTQWVLSLSLLIPINLFAMIGLFVIYLKFWPTVDNLVRIHENCTQFTAKYRYIIRFVFRKVRPPFNITKTTVKVDVLNNQSDVISNFDIEPNLLLKYKVNDPKAPFNTIRFLLCRSEPLTDITFLRLNHNGEGEMVVIEVQIQELSSSEANVAVVNTTIKSLSMENASMAQTYPASTKQVKELEEELRSSQKLDVIEHLVFIYFSLNLVTLLTIFLIPCLTGLCAQYEYGFKSAAISGVTTGLVVYLVYVIIGFSFENVIKKPFVVGYEICSVFRCIGLLLMAVIALFIGIFASFLVINGEFPITSDDVLSNEVYWVFASIIGIITFILLAVMFAAICRKCYPSVEYREKTQKSKSQSRSPSRSQASHSRSTQSKYSNKDSVVSSKSEQSVRTGAKKSPSTESTGSGYYQQLLKNHGKVKSISQYKGPKK